MQIIPISLIIPSTVEGCWFLMRCVGDIDSFWPRLITDESHQHEDDTWHKQQQAPCYGRHSTCSQLGFLERQTKRRRKREGRKGRERNGKETRKKKRGKQKNTKERKRKDGRWWMEASGVALIIGRSWWSFFFVPGCGTHPSALIARVTFPRQTLSSLLLRRSLQVVFYSAGLRGGFFRACLVCCIENERFPSKGTWLPRSLCIVPKYVAVWGMQQWQHPLPAAYHQGPLGTSVIIAWIDKFCILWQYRS